MRSWSLPILAVLATGIAASSCRGRNEPSAQLRADETAPAATTANEASSVPEAAPDCGEIDAVSSEKLTGGQVFDLTSRCVFDRDVHEVRIRILSETFQKVLDDGCADKDSGYGHVIELVLDGKRIENVGIKVRGNTSKCSPKRQFKFKFDAEQAFSVYAGNYEMKEFPANDGRTFFGLEGFSVRASANDPTMIRERISSRVFISTEELAPIAERGGLVYRVAFAKLFVSFNRPQNQGPEGSFTRLFDNYYYDYKGLYSLSENIDKTYLRSRFQKGDEKMKGFFLYQADLAKAWFEKAKYDRKGWSAEYVDGKKVDDEASAVLGDQKILELIALLESNATEAQLAAVIDVDNIVNYVTGVMLTGHWDSMIANRNNDWLFFNGAKKQWQIIAWDLDNSQGALVDQYHDLMQPHLYKPAKNGGKLFTELFSEARPTFRAKLKDRVKKILAGSQSESSFEASVDMLENTVKTSVEGWEGYSHGSFEDIKNFVKARKKALKPQL